MKRALDVVFSLANLIAFAPILVAIACAISLTSKGPVLFRQRRIGKDGRPFTILKFRSMTNDPHAPTVTAVGQFLRISSLDELPQLANILIGDMSFVGPRPLMPRDQPCDCRTKRIRGSVRPGLTGLAQVSGRNRLTDAERFELDRSYVAAQSTALDLQILFTTLVRVATCDGAQAGPHSRPTANILDRRWNDLYSAASK
jgi:lipopolysaccharide/colanic/teichoic acid biosynthesis glycosyltransferase